MSEKEIIFKLKQEINKLLKERPDLVPLQKQIDILLATAGNQNNRCALIQKLMLDKAMELKDRMVELQELIKKNVDEQKKE